ncbi:hypothetical protein AA0Z99_09830 [Agrococcus sp. 1P02AA]|uniref:hypothetical protein n=1 Tax=Agrococcus sp. 1P02AA TaxID=3132259 RepID=UPI0039A654ED
MTGPAMGATPGGGRGETETVSLREALGAARAPEFHLTVPSGWARIATDEAGQRLLERRMGERMMQTGRPDLTAGLRSMLRESLDAMREHGAVALFIPMDEHGLGQVGAPTSITAYARRSTEDERLDDYVQHVIRRFDAQPLHGDLRTLRFETESAREIDDLEAIISTTHYITPVPGTRRQRAIELLATYGRPASMPREDERVEGLHALFDICASTVRWSAPREGGTP